MPLITHCIQADGRCPMLTPYAIAHSDPLPPSPWQVQGETWSVGADGRRYNRWWGENHYGEGWVQKFGHSTEGKSTPFSKRSSKALLGGVAGCATYTYLGRARACRRAGVPLPTSVAVLLCLGFNHPAPHPPPSSHTHTRQPSPSLPLPCAPPAGEHWDATEQSGTYYNCNPHFNYKMAVSHSPVLHSVPLLPREGPAAAAEASRSAGASRAPWPLLTRL